MCWLPHEGCVWLDPPLLSAVSSWSSWKSGYPPLFLLYAEFRCCPSTALMDFLQRWKQMFYPRQLIQELRWYSI
jgi:hypothetical protein